MAPATSLVNFAGEVIGGSLGPIIGGALADKYNLYVPIILAAGGLIIVFLLTLGYKETAPKKVNHRVRTDQEIAG